MTRDASPGADYALIKQAVRQHILDEFFLNDDAGRVEDTSPLISSGAMDSLSVLSVVGFIEARFGVGIAPHEMSVENLDSIEDITALVVHKRAA